MHIIGLSPQNDSHIFACIEKSSLDKVVFYSYGEPPKKLPLTKPYEFADIKQLWKSLDANQPQYNCGRKYPDSDEAKKFFELFNALSLDPITKEEIEKEANSIPEYMALPLCKEAMNLIKVQTTPKSEEAPASHPFQFISGIGYTLGRFEKEILALKKGDNFNFTIPCAEAYGERDEDNVRQVPNTVLKRIR